MYDRDTCLRCNTTPNMTTDARAPPGIAGGLTRYRNETEIADGRTCGSRSPLNDSNTVTTTSCLPRVGKSDDAGTSNDDIKLHVLTKRGEFGTTAH